MSFAIVVARFYEDLADRLVGGAQTAFAEAGAGEADVFDVPGAFELPLAAQLRARRPAATTASPASAPSSAARPTTTTGSAPRPRAGIQDVQLRTGVPCAFGVLTVDTMEQALERSGGGKRDSGRHAAEAVLALARLREELGAH